MKTLSLNLKFKALFIIILAFSFSTLATAQKKKKLPVQIDTISINIQANTPNIEINFVKGESHNHPTFVIWLENKDGSYLETLYVTEYVGTGIYASADGGNGTWKGEKGEAIRPASLPYWAHKRNIISRDSIYVPTPENPVPDALTGATPSGNFLLKTSLPVSTNENIRILLEINQPWDWNEYWTNKMYLNDIDYRTSAQPSIIYAGEINLSKKNHKIRLKPIGHGHYSGKNGELYTDLNTFTTALDIVADITLTFTK